MNFDEYIRQSEPLEREKGIAWQTAIGLQQVDGLNTSDYLIDTARQHIEGDITIEQVKELIDNYYKKSNQIKPDESRTEEADKVAVKIAEILSEESFNFSVVEYITIHRRLFEGIFATSQYLEQFFRNLLMGEQNELKNIYIHITMLNDTVSDTVNDVLEAIKKDRNITLDGLDQVATKLRSTVARKIKQLKEQGEISRVGSDETGRWEIKR